MRNPNPQSNSSRTIRVGLLVAAAFLMAVPAAAAQFGAQLKAGDYGHVPVTKGAAVPFKVQQIDFGTQGDVRDNCAYIDVTSVVDGANALKTDGGLTNKDIRLVPCFEFKAGTTIADVATTEKTGGATYVATVLKYADVNSNGKYDAGDHVYVVAGGAADPALPGPGGANSWSIRLTPAGDKASGTWVMTGDADFGTFQNAVKTLTMAVVEREDSMWFAIAHTYTSKPYDAKGALVLGDSLRLTTAAPPQPTIVVNKVELTTPDIPAGDSFTAKAEVQNIGKGPGIGVIISRINGVIVDAQATPMMSPGEKVMMTMKAWAPLTGNFACFEVGTQFVRITVVGGKPAADAGVEELVARISALEAQVLGVTEAASRSDEAARGGAIVPQGNAASAGEAPSPSLVVLAVAVGVVALLRRKGNG